jgi:hypothetical protein
MVLLLVGGIMNYPQLGQNTNHSLLLDGVLVSLLVVVTTTISVVQQVLHQVQVLTNKVNIL